ncbi:MAG: DMT family transporter [Pseudomonadales bacterium]|nr:DMT family transporter [Pseudomonadales bacterium]
MNNLTKLAYLVVIAVWSTTPLAIKWSSVGIHPLWGSAIRILIATVCILLIIRVWRQPIPLHLTALKNYLAGGLGLFGGLIFVYTGAAFVPSGLISVLYGLSPILSGVLAYYLIDDPPFSVSKWLALVFSVMGLAVIFSDDIQLSEKLIFGVVLVLISVLFFCLSAVLIKRYQHDGHPLAQTTGSLLVCLPLFLISASTVADDVNYSDIQMTTKLSIIYLAIVGSIIGMLCYYYVLNKMSPSSVALITVITPVIALFLGVNFNGEVFSSWSYAGVFMILVGLAVFNWGDRYITGRAPTG